jgi:hypothetical protein
MVEVIGGSCGDKAGRTSESDETRKASSKEVKPKVGRKNNGHRHNLKIIGQSMFISKYPTKIRLR